MAHMVETMAYANDTPWHRLGTRVSDSVTIEEMQRAAGLDWTVSKRPLTYMEDGAPVVVDSKTALVRDTDGKLLDIVGPDWHPLQNKDCLEFFRAFCVAGGATLETAGSLDGGRVVWALANLGAGFTLPGGDTIHGYVLLASPHRSGKAIRAMVTTVRVVCANTLKIATSEKSKYDARFDHRKPFDRVEALETLGLAKSAVADFERTARTLQSIRVSLEDAVRMLCEVYAPTALEDRPEIPKLFADEWPRTVKDIMTSALKAPGAVPGTAWGLLNGATHYHDHVSGSNRNPDARMTSSWLGQGADRKDDLLAKLLALA